MFFADVHLYFNIFSLIYFCFFSYEGVKKYV